MVNSSEYFQCQNQYSILDLLKDDVDKDKKRAATQAAFKKKFKKNSDFWVYEKKIRLVIRKAIKQQWFYWTVIVLGKLWTLFKAIMKIMDHKNRKFV